MLSGPAAPAQLGVQTATNAQGPETATAPDPAGNQAKLRILLYPKAPNSVSIDVTNLTRGSPDDIPVRPGDVIIVPASGSVLVQGWVRTPGAYPITPGLDRIWSDYRRRWSDVQFNCSTFAGRIIRANARNMNSISPKSNTVEQQDIQVESGDVVVVNKSATGALPYGVYFLAEHFGTGISMGATAF